MNLSAGLVCLIQFIQIKERILNQEICHLLGVTKTRTTPYHLQSDGLVERFNRTLLEMLSTTVVDEHDWDLSLPTLLLAYRTSVQETTGTTPFQLMFGRNPRLPEDIQYSLPVQSHDSVTQYTIVLKGRLQRSYQAVIKHVQHAKLARGAEAERSCSLLA